MKEHKKTCKTCLKEKYIGEFELSNIKRPLPNCKNCMSAKRKYRYQTDSKYRQSKIDAAQRWYRKEKKRLSDLENKNA